MSYSEKDVSWFPSDLAKIRARPAMYIGPVDGDGVFTIAREPCDNGVDEARAGRNSLIHIWVDTAKADFWIADLGVGIPVKKHPKAKISTLTHIVTNLQSSAKMEGDAYTSAIGCFVGATKIKCLDGTSPTIETLFKRWSKNKQKFWVYAFKLDGDLPFEARECYGVHKTKMVSEIAVVTLDNGKKIRCTVDHPFLSFDGNWIEAQNLRPGQSLRSLHTTKDSDGYETHSGRHRFTTAESHKVESVRIQKLREPVQVYGMSVKSEHNYLLDAGVFVKNTHGVGIKATNALSSLFEIWTYRKDAGGWHYTKFASGVEVVKAKKSKAPKTPDGKAAKKGTVIHWIPDTKIFGKAKLSPKRLDTWAEITSYMNAGLTVKRTLDGKTKTFFSKRGVIEYLEKRVAELKAGQVSPKIVNYHSKHLEIALSFTNCEGCEMEFFTNTIRNVDEGFHAEAFRKAMHKSILPYAGRNRDKFTQNDLMDGLIGVVNLKIDAPQFSSQTKDKLVDVRIKKPCFDECLTVFSDFWNKHKALAKELCLRAATLREKTASFLEDKALAKGVKQAKNELSAKLSDVDGSRPASECELFLVEGDSAGGTAKKARERDFQAVFPLKGKPLNCLEASKDKISGNKEVHAILCALGIDPGSKEPIKKLKYGRIIFLADPDVDGSHINVLLIGMFWKFLPHFFKEGKIFLVKSPEYYAKLGEDKYVFGSSVEKVKEKLGERKAEIKHIKGWGEVNPSEIAAIAMTPGIRKLYRILPPADKKEALAFQALLGKDSSYRKKLLGITQLPLKRVKEAA